jgi:OOP family OmpA-OmpF porin
VIWGIPNEQNDLTARATDLLAGSGLDVKFEGRDATIVGSADRGVLDSAERTIRNLRGVRRVDISDATVEAQEAQEATTTAAPVPLTLAFPETDTPAELEEPSFDARYSAGRLQISGTLPTDEIVAAVEDAAEEVFGANEVISSLEVGAVASPDYLTSLSDIFSVAAGLDPWNFSIDRGTTVFAGQGASAAAVTEKQSAIEAFAAAVALGAIDVALEVNPDAVAAALTDLLAEGANFETGSAILSADATARLDTVSETLLANPSTVVTVEGHTDDQGSATANQLLSEARAQAVVDYLLARGIGSERLTAVGYGEDRPIADNDTTEGRAANRRIEFVVNEGEQP